MERSESGVFASEDGDEERGEDEDEADALEDACAAGAAEESQDHVDDDPDHGELDEHLDGAVGAVPIPDFDDDIKQFGGPFSGGIVGTRSRIHQL